jgi:hypothetical protein
MELANSLACLVDVFSFIRIAYADQYKTHRTPGDDPGVSAGLWTPLPPRFRMGVWILVVRTA